MILCGWMGAVRSSASYASLGIISFKRGLMSLKATESRERVCERLKVLTLATERAAIEENWSEVASLLDERQQVIRRLSTGSVSERERIILGAAQEAEHRLMAMLASWQQATAAEMGRVAMASKRLKNFHAR